MVKVQALVDLTWNDPEGQVTGWGGGVVYRWFDFNQDQTKGEQTKLLSQLITPQAAQKLTGGLGGFDPPW